MTCNDIKKIIEAEMSGDRTSWYLSKHRTGLDVSYHLYIDNDDNTSGQSRVCIDVEIPKVGMVWFRASTMYGYDPKAKKYTRETEPYRNTPEDKRVKQIHDVFEKIADESAHQYAGRSWSSYQG